MGPPRAEKRRWSANGYKQGQEANYKLLPPFLWGDGPALRVMDRKILKNNALAVILP